MNLAAIPPHPAPVPEDRTGLRCLLAVACCLCVAVPFLMARFPPISDLPQQVAQIRLFLNAWHHPQGLYRIQWFTPYSLSYTVLGAAWALFSPVNVGRMAMLAMGILWTLGTHLLAAKRRRSAAAAVLVSVLFFNHIVYWGFYSFAIGWPAFVVWFLLTVRPPAVRAPWVETLAFFGAALLLYSSHALWFAAAVAWFVIYSVAFRIPLAVTARRGAGFLPVCIAAALWYPHLRAEGFTSPTIWSTMPTGRLSFSWLANATLGAIHGPVEYVVFFVLVAWVVIAAWQHRARLAERSDHALLLCVAMFSTAAFLLPHLYQNTIEFDTRWFPPAMIMLVLALPLPIYDVTVERAGALALVAVFSLATTLTWLRYDRVELSGLQRVLDALPAAPRVLGLDYVEDSALIKGRPFLQTFAYAQVLHGGELNFSFAQFAPSLVVYKRPRRVTWTGALEWFADRVKASDFAAFDYVIVNAGARRQQDMAAMPMLTPVTHDGRWRLYRVEHRS